MENNTIEETGKRVFADTNALKDTAAQAAKNLGEHATKAKSQVNQLGHDVADHAAAHVENAKGRVKDAYGTFRDYGSEHPVTILTVGLVAGFILALSRRS